MREARTLKPRAARSAWPAGSAPHDAGDQCYYDRGVQAYVAKVLPAEYLVTRRDIALVTLLGSCVAACIRDPVAGVGGMNHFMLPDRGDGIAGESTRYGAYAMERLINDVLKLGGARGRLEAKLFGGGTVLRDSTCTVGERNAQFARAYLRAERIPVVAEDLLTHHPRKVYFFPVSGRVLVKRLPDAFEADVRERDDRYRRQLEQGVVNAGSVELFE